jgi:hypothetical protein
MNDAVLEKTLTVKNIFFYYYNGKHLAHTILTFEKNSCDFNEMPANYDSQKLRLYA